MYSRGAVALLDFFESLILADAVFYVDHVVADLQIAEVGEERRDFGFLAAGAAGNQIGFVEEIAGSEDRDVSFGEDEAIGNVGLEERGGEDFAGEVGGFVGIALAAASAATEAELALYSVKCRPGARLLQYWEQRELRGAAAGCFYLFDHALHVAVEARAGWGKKRSVFDTDLCRTGRGARRSIFQVPLPERE